MKILFIYPDIFAYTFSKGIFYTGIASISAVLKKETSWSVGLKHLTKTVNRQALISQVKEYSPDLIAFSSTTNMYSYVLTWASWIKEELSEVKIVCGGVHAIMDPEEVIQDPNIDIVCIGEGEYPLSELCNAIEKGLPIDCIAGLWIKHSGKIHRNPPRPLIQNLDELPFCDRSIFDYENLHYESQGRAAVMLSRGCPYSCKYCCNETLRKIHNVSVKAYVRFRSVSHSIEELKELKSKHRFIKSFAFEDDILPLNKDWFREFVRLYKKEIGLPYDCNLRPNLINKEIVSLLKESGCVELRIGIESGNDFIRNEILGRNISREQIITACRLCNDAGIKVYSFNIIGLPFESREMMLDTVRLNAELETSVNQVTIFYPYKKTPLFETCYDGRLIDSAKKVYDYSKDTILKFGLIRRNQIVFVQKYFRVLVKFHRMLKKLPGKARVISCGIFENLFFSNISSAVVLPFLSSGMDFIVKNRYLSPLAKKVYRKFLK